MADSPTPAWRRIVFWLACAFVLVAVVGVLLDDRPWSQKQLPLGFAVLFLVGVLLRLRERRRESARGAGGTTGSSPGSSSGSSSG